MDQGELLSFLHRPPNPTTCILLCHTRELHPSPFPSADQFPQLLSSDPHSSPIFGALVIPRPTPSPGNLQSLSRPHERREQHRANHVSLASSIRDAHRQQDRRSKNKPSGADLPMQDRFSHLFPSPTSTPSPNKTASTISAAVTRRAQSFHHSSCSAIIRCISLAIRPSPSPGQEPGASSRTPVYPTTIPGTYSFLVSFHSSNPGGVHLPMQAVPCHRVGAPTTTCYTAAIIVTWSL